MKRIKRRGMQVFHTEIEQNPSNVANPIGLPITSMPGRITMPPNFYSNHKSISSKNQQLPDKNSTLKLKRKADLISQKRNYIDTYSEDASITSGRNKIAPTYYTSASEYFKSVHNKEEPCNKSIFETINVAYKERLQRKDSRVAYNSFCTSLERELVVAPVNMKIKCSKELRRTIRKADAAMQKPAPKNSILNRNSNKEPFLMFSSPPGEASYETPPRYWFQNESNSTSVSNNECNYIFREPLFNSHENDHAKCNIPSYLKETPQKQGNCEIFHADGLSFTTNSCNSNIRPSPVDLYKEIKFNPFVDVVMKQENALPSREHLNFCHQYNNDFQSDFLMLPQLKEPSPLKWYPRMMYDPKPFLS